MFIIVSVEVTVCIVVIPACIVVITACTAIILNALKTTVIPETAIISNNDKQHAAATTPFGTIIDENALHPRLVSKSTVKVEVKVTTVINAFATTPITVTDRSPLLWMTEIGK